jgi:hypothetical protein
MLQTEPRQVTVERKLSKQAVGSDASRGTVREWTAAEKFRLKGLAKQGHSAEKIARVLRRPVDATIAMASKLGHRLS